MAMKLTGHKTEVVYRRYVTVCGADLTDGLKKLALVEQSSKGKIELSHRLATISSILSRKPHITGGNMAEEPVFS